MRFSFIWLFASEFSYICVVSQWRIYLPAFSFLHLSFIVCVSLFYNFILVCATNRRTWMNFFCSKFVCSVKVFLFDAHFKTNVRFHLNLSEFSRKLNFAFDFCWVFIDLACSEQLSVINNILWGISYIYYVFRRIVKEEKVECSCTKLLVFEKNPSCSGLFVPSNIFNCFSALLCNKMHSRRELRNIQTKGLKKSFLKQNCQKFA